MPYGLACRDKNQDLKQGKGLSADEFAFDFTLSVQRHSDGSANFTGPFAHGARTQRFVYLTYKVPEGESWQIWRRIKVSLTIISWEQGGGGFDGWQSSASAGLRFALGNGATDGRRLAIGGLAAGVKAA